MVCVFMEFPAVVPKPLAGGDHALFDDGSQLRLYADVTKVCGNPVLDIDQRVSHLHACDYAASVDVGIGIMMGFD